MVNLEQELKSDFIEVSPREFYRDIFKHDLDIKNKFTKGKFTGIACEFTDKIKANGKQLVKRYSITDDLDTIDELLKSDNFIIISPISYFGKERKTENARVMYAFAIEIDELRKYEDGRQIGYEELVYQFEKKNLPTPNYIVASGNGLHLYYIFEKPLMLFDNVKKSLVRFKKAFTRILWNRYITNLSDEEKIQYESAFQGFRMAGGVTKNNERTKVFKVWDKPCTIEHLNSFIWEEEDYIEVAYKSDFTLAEAKEKYPEWYEKRIVRKEKKGSWVVKRDLYDWWFREIKEKKKVGHRYYCIMCLCVYAIKCNISREELEKDCFSLLKLFDADSKEESNRFTVKDISDALQSFEDKELVTYPIDIISKRTGIEIKKNKRNGRKQIDHIKLMNFVRDEINKNITWNKIGNGRKSKEEIVIEWRNKNPKGRKIDCSRETGLHINTVYKWW